MPGARNDARLRRVATLLVGAVALFGVAACGGSDEDDAKDVVKDFMNGLADEDGQKVCDQLSQSAKEPIERSGADCGEQFEGLAREATQENKDQLKDIDPDVSVDGDEATAKVPNIGGPGESEIKLKKEDGDWKITDLGS